MEIKKIMKELENNVEMVEILADYDIDHEISESIHETINNKLIYYSDINEIFENSDEEIKDEVILLNNFNNFRDYKTEVAFQQLHLDIYEDIASKLIYAALDYLYYNNIELTEDLYSDMEYYSESEHCDTVEDFLIDLEIL